MRGKKEKMEEAWNQSKNTEEEKERDYENSLINNNGVLIINWKIELLLSHYHWRHSLLSYLSLKWIISRLEHLTVQVN